MVNKISHIILALLLLITSVGVTVSKHYCGDSLESVTVVVTPEPCCEIPSGCCHDESTTIKLEDSYSVTSFSFVQSQFAVLLPLFVDLIQNGTIESSSINNQILIPPPPLKIQTVLASIQLYLI